MDRNLALFGHFTGESRISFTLAEVLICIYSLALGFVRFSVLSGCFSFCTRFIEFSPFQSLIVVHSVMACMYFQETLTGAVTKTKLGTNWTSIILSTTLTISFAFTYLLENSRKSAWLSALGVIFICFILGGLINCLKQILKNEYDLPSQLDRYNLIKFVVMEFEYIGKTLGGLLSMDWYETAQPNAFLKASSFRVACSGCILLVTIWGYSKFKQQRNYDNLIRKFIIHTVLTVKANFSNKTEADNFSSEEVERIKVVHSVLPLYVPVIILIGLKDIKFSLYAWQSQKMVLQLSEYNNLNSQLILITYPLTVALTNPLFFFVVSPLLKKLTFFKTWEYSRALCAFYLMSISIASALILECRLEMDSDNIVLNKTMSRIITANLLPCALKLESRCVMERDYVVPEITVQSALCRLSDEYNSIRVQGSCQLKKKTHFLSITILLFGLDEIYLAAGFDYTGKYDVDNHNGNDEIATAAFVDHVHMNSNEMNFNAQIFIIYNVLRDNLITFVQITGKTDIREIDPDSVEGIEQYVFGLAPKITRLTKLDFGWYAVFLGKKMVSRIHYSPLSTFVVLVYEEMSQNETVASVVETSKTLKHSVFQQLPQIITSSLSEMLIDSPGFVYAYKKVPEQWQEFVGLVWSFSCFLGNIAVILLNIFVRENRNLLILIYASASSTVGIALVSVYLLDYYKEDYSD